MLTDIGCHEAERSSGARPSEGSHSVGETRRTRSNSSTRRGAHIIQARFCGLKVRAYERAVHGGRRFLTVREISFAVQSRRGRPFDTQAIEFVDLGHLLGTAVVDP